MSEFKVDIVDILFVDGTTKKAVRLTRPIFVPTYRSCLFGLVQYEDGGWKNTGEVATHWVEQGDDGLLYLSSSRRPLPPEHVEATASMARERNWQPVYGGAFRE